MYFGLGSVWLDDCGRGINSQCSSLRSHLPLEDTKKSLHQQFLFGNFFLFEGETGSRFGIFPGYVGKIIDLLWSLQAPLEPNLLRPIT